MQALFFSKTCEFSVFEDDGFGERGFTGMSYTFEKIEVYEGRRHAGQCVCAGDCRVLRPPVWNQARLRTRNG